LLRNIAKLGFGEMQVRALFRLALVFVHYFPHSIPLRQAGSLGVAPSSAAASAAFLWCATHAQQTPCLGHCLVHGQSIWLWMQGMDSVVYMNLWLITSSYFFHYSLH